jgi:hypothetical protein
MYEIVVSDGRHKSTKKCSDYTRAYECFLEAVHSEPGSKVELFEIEETGTLLSEGEYGELL